MLARTSTLALVASLAAVIVASPLPGGGDGEDIRFVQIKKINEDKFKKTKFNVHDATEHDKNFNQVEAKEKDVLKAVDFEKEDNDRFYVKRGIESFEFIDTSLIDTPFIGSTFLDTEFIDVDSLDDVSDFGILRKRGGGHGDGEEIRFVQVKKINEDKFKKTNFNVHDRTEHDKNFNQVEAKDRDVLKVVDFRKEEDDFDHGRSYGGKYGHGDKYGDNYY